MRIGICGALAMALLVPQLGCRRRSAQAQAEAEKAAEQHEYEALVAGKDKDGERAMEARQYLAPNQPANGLWKTSRVQTLDWVNQLYQAGAAKVYAVYSPADDTIRINMCASLLVELPAAPEARTKVLRAFNEIDKLVWGEDHEAVTDMHQKFVMLNMDP